MVNMSMLIYRNGVLFLLHLILIRLHFENEIASLYRNVLGMENR